MATKVMLLIDADNVSVDIIDQAVQRLLDSFGAVHVRRAYCTAEGAVKHQAAFKRLGIRPMVNLATGKNSTDIALAVDAMDLVVSERPDVVVIASSDSDFAPLVARLREKGCRVEGIGQQGKTGEETLRVYDAYTVLAHRENGTGAARAPRGGTTTRAARSTAKAAAASETPAPAKPSAKAAPRRTAKVAAKSVTSADLPPVVKPATSDAPERAATGRRRGRATTEKAPAPPSSPSARSPASPPEQPRTPSPARPARAAASAAPAPAPVRSASATDFAAVLAALPELAAGQSLALNQVSQRLREAGLLGPNASTTRLLGRFADRLELMPAGQPNRVRQLPSA